MEPVFNVLLFTITVSHALMGQLVITAILPSSLALETVHVVLKVALPATALHVLTVILVSSLMEFLVIAVLLFVQNALPLLTALNVFRDPTSTQVTLVSLAS